VISLESRALRHLFFAERERAKVPDVPRGIAHASGCARRGDGAGTWAAASRWSTPGRHPGALKDVDAAALERGMATIRKNYESSVAKGKLSKEAYAKTIGLITPTTTYDGFDGVDLVVEAVFENMDLKKATFRRALPRHPSGVRPGIQHVDARHRRIGAASAGCTR